MTAFFVASLEDTTPKTLPSLFPNLLETASGARVEFYKLQHTGGKHDHDFVHKYEQDLKLNITLIFVSAFSVSTLTVVLICFLGEQASLFSIVTSIFIVDVRSNPTPTGLHTAELRPPSNYRRCLAWKYSNWSRWLSLDGLPLIPWLPAPWPFFTQVWAFPFPSDAWICH